ncbi:MAG: GAF domain-containing protein [Saprospirales bacterium]|nr:MAG: GAF domain-containing protein [Saprospirales bacterium]
MKVASYEISEQISATDKTNVYIAYREGISDKQFIVKKANSSSRLENAEILLRNEFEISRELDEVNELSEYFESEGQKYFARIYFEGITLKEWNLKLNPKLSEKLKYCKLIAEKLSFLHAKKLIHKDLSPSNILVNPQNGQVFIIDFDLSSRLDQKSYFIETNQKLEGTLPYMSPEQTGRMNRSVDYRSDLYAMGIIMFELFAGLLPFDSEDSLEIIHGHLSRKPPHLNTLNSEIPEVLNQIVQKLLSKNAEDRYQSAHGLSKDLEECFRQYTENQQIETFPLASLDKPLHFQIPEKLYGREKEIEELLRVFSKVSNGKKMLVSVGGYSGVGKSKLVHHLNIPISLKNGFFVSGKFDLIQRNTPYLAWIQAFQKFAEILFSKDREEIDKWKKRILDAMGESAGVITKLIPNLEQILGVQTLMEDLTANEDQNRFNYALRQFVKAISTKENPLLIFLDDFQWADTASLSLLKTILTEPGLGHLFIVAAYRDNEVDINHPYMVCLEDAHNEWLKVNETDVSSAYSPDNELIKSIWVKNLSPDDLYALIRDTFRGKSKQYDQLVELVFSKTQGNPFFVHQFLESLNYDGLIKLIQTEHGLDWYFDFDGIEKSEITENVVDLLNHQIERLPAETIEILKIASCLGHSFELHDLAAIANKSVKKTEQILFEALNADYILPRKADYKFVESYEHRPDVKVFFKFSHDRVAQTFYLALDKAEKEKIHASAFELQYPLIANIEELSEHVFEIAGHLQNSGNLIEDEQIISKVFYTAGLKAMSSSAYSLAYDYFLKVSSLYPNESAWEKNYDFLVKLTVETAQSAYLSQLYDESEQLIKVLLKKAKNRKDYARGIEVLLDAYFVQQRFEEAVVLGIQTLHKFDFKIPKDPSKLYVMFEFVKTNVTIGKFNPDDLQTLPQLHDDELIPAMRLMPLLIPSAFFYSSNLFVVIVLKLAVFTVKNGVSTYTTQSFANYSFMLCAIAGNYKKGIGYSDNILKLLEDKNLDRYKTRTKFSSYFFVEHYKTCVYNTLPLLKKTFKEGLENGDSDFTAFVGNAFVQNSFLTGSALSDLSVEVRRQIQYNIQVKNLTSKTFSDIYYQYIACLQGDAEEVHTLSGKYFNATEEIPKLQAINNKGGLNNFHISQTFLKLLFGKFKEASEEVLIAEKYKELIMGVPMGNYLPFLKAVCFFARFLEDSKFKRKALQQIKKEYKPIRKIAKQCKDDFEHKDAFVVAMLNALKGDVGKSLLLFQQSIDLMDMEKNRFDKALCNYIFGMYCKSIGIADLAYLKIKESRKLFELIQATAVVDYHNSLLNEFNKYFGAISERDSSVSVSNSITHEGIDLFSVIKSTHVISSEFELEELLKKMLPVIIENAGAEKGAIILLQKDKMLVKACTNNSGEVVFYKKLGVEDFDISVPILNFTYNTGQAVILEHAHLTGRFVNDEYITKNKVRSLLCMAITHKNKLTGLLYLENNLISGAFNQNRIQVLNILATQASISIENARFFSHINQLNIAYERFVPKSFLSYLNKDSILNIQVGDQVKKEMAVLFADIRNFTGISEKLNSEEVFNLLNEIWGLLNPTIEKYGGIIDKYIGDAIMVLFPQKGTNAIHAAIEMQKLLKDFNEMRQSEGDFIIKMGIGINSGSLNLGTLGSDNRLNTTVIGDTVNIASRLEFLTKKLGAQVLYTSKMLKPDEPGIFYRNLGQLPIKGKEQGVTIIEEYSSQPFDYKVKIEKNIALFNQIIQLHDNGKSDQCKSLIQTYQMEFPKDGVVNFLESILE